MVGEQREGVGDCSASTVATREPSRVSPSRPSGRVPTIAGFRWECMCLSDDPFTGDYGGSGDGDAVLSDRMVTNRKGGECHMCAGECAPGTRNRVRVEVYDGELMRFRWCQTCCFTMAVYPHRPTLAERQCTIGHERRLSTIAKGKQE